ncbi:unnamed protein product [Gongylonema pulchrum]|uniref:Vasculin n=1 Tax=Gongylonema pulchrum TaxID=637853 RepID=A0A183CX29_9BILA|nr:unnamed protein product [Gongylonema pulchrum]
MAKAFDLNVYKDDDDEPGKEDEEPNWENESISTVIRRMSRTNKWTSRKEDGDAEKHAVPLQRATSLPGDDYELLLAYTERARKFQASGATNPGAVSPGAWLHQTMWNSENSSAVFRKPQLTTSTVRTPSPHHHYVPTLGQNFNKPLSEDSEKSRNWTSPAPRTAGFKSTDARPVSNAF